MTRMRTRSSVIASNSNVANAASSLASPSPSSRLKPTPTRLSLKSKLSDETLETEESSSKEKFRALLDESIGYNCTASTALLTDIQTLRQTDELGLNMLLDDLLSLTDSLPFWTRIKRLSRFSRRARYASLQRLLGRFTPSTSRSNDNDDTFKQQERRRALVAILRSLAELESDTTESKDDIGERQAEEKSHRKSISSRTTKPAILVLEKKAIQDDSNNAGEFKGSNGFRDRLPEGLETPKYEVVDTLQQISKKRRRRQRMNAVVEIREYEPYSVCAVSMDRPRPTATATGNSTSTTDAKVSLPQLSGASSFGALAGYLFGKNDQSTSMKMTTPVFTTTATTTTTASTDDESTTELDTERQMQFVLPSQYWSTTTPDNNQNGNDNQMVGGISSAPRPLEGSGVELQTVDSETRAVIMFGGYSSSEEVRKRQDQLLSILSEHEDTWTAIEAYKDQRDFSLAQYNDPFTPPWKRLNEISILVASKITKDNNDETIETKTEIGNVADEPKKKQDEKKTETVASM